MEYNDIYDAKRNRTGKIHRRGTPWRKGEYGFVVCVWVYDGEGKVLMTRRAPQKSFLHALKSGKTRAMPLLSRFVCLKDTVSKMWAYGPINPLPA